MQPVLFDTGYIFYLIANPIQYLYTRIYIYIYFFFLAKNSFLRCMLW